MTGSSNTEVGCRTGSCRSPSDESAGLAGVLDGVTTEGRDVGLEGDALASIDATNSRTIGASTLGRPTLWTTVGDWTPRAGCDRLKNAAQLGPCAASS